MLFPFSRCILHRDFFALRCKGQQKLDKISKKINKNGTG